MLGYEAGELVGKKVSQIDPTNSGRNQFIAEDVISAAVKDGYWEGEIENTKKDGSSLISYAKIVCVEHDPQEKLLISVQEDCSRTKQRESDLLIAQKLTEISLKNTLEFLAKKIHEIRNSINAIQGFCQILSANCAALNLTPTVIKQLGYIQTSSETLEKVIDDIAAFTQNQSDNSATLEQLPSRGLRHAFK